jgi:hypothetical protein
MQGWIPRPLIVAAIVFVAIIELVSRTPDMLLIKERYDAQKAEYLAKLYLTDTAKAQLQKAEADADRSVSEAKAAQLQPDLVKAQLARAEAEATVAHFSALAAPNQPGLVQAQLEKAVNDAKTSKIQPELTAAQLQNAQLEAQNRTLQPQLTQMQMAKLGLDTQVVLATLPNTQAGAAIGQQFLKIMAPWMGVLVGMVPQPPTQTQIPATEPDPSPTPVAMPAPFKPGPNVRQNPIWSDERVVSQLSRGVGAMKVADCNGVSSSLANASQVIPGSSQTNYGTDEQQRNAKLYLNLISYLSDTCHMHVPLPK